MRSRCFLLGDVFAALGCGCPCGRTSTGKKIAGPTVRRTNELIRKYRRSLCAAAFLLASVGELELVIGVFLKVLIVNLKAVKKITMRLLARQSKTISSIGAV